MARQRTLPRLPVTLMLWALLALPLMPRLALADPGKEEQRLFMFGKKSMEDRLNEMAEAQFEKLLSQFPQTEYREQALLMLARARMEQGNWRGALQDLEPALPTVAPAQQASFYLLIGEAQLKGDMAEAALRTYTALIEKQPQERPALEARLGMAQAQLQLHQPDAAMESLRALPKDAPREISSRAALLMGRIFIQQKKPDQATEILTRLARDEAKRSAGFQAIYALGELEMDRHKPETARARFESLVKTDQPEAQVIAPLAYLRLGELEAGTGNWAAAATQFEQAFRKSDDTAFRLHCVDSLSEAYLKLDKVRTLTDKLADWSDENARTRLGEALRLQIGSLWQRAGRRDQAIQAFQDFFEKYPSGAWNAQAHYQLGWVFLDDKKYESAASEFQKAAERAKEPQVQLDALLKLGDLNFERGQFEAAAAAYTKASQVKTVDPVRVEQALYQAALSNFRAGNYSEVLRLQGLYATNHPAGKLGAEFLVLTAETSRRAGNMQRVSDDLKILLDRYPDSPLAPKSWVDYAESLFALGSFKEAMETLNAFLEKNPKHELAPRATLLRARCLDRLGQVDKAVAELENLIRTFPKSPVVVEARFWLGAHYDRIKNYAKSQEQFELIHRSAPSHPLAPEAAYFAALAAYRLGQNKEDAPRLIEAFVKEFPTSPWIFDARFLYADILTERGKFQDALLIFEDLTHSPELAKDPALVERLLEVQGRRGQCLRQLKRYDEALAAFKLVLDSSKADAALRNQAYVETGKTLENMGDLKRALENYLAPLYERPSQSDQPESREFFWVCRGGFEAVRLLEMQKDWKGAARVLKRMMDTNLPVRKEAEERLKKLQTEHAIAN